MWFAVLFASRVPPLVSFSRETALSNATLLSRRERAEKKRSEARLAASGAFERFVRKRE